MVDHGCLASTIVAAAANGLLDANYMFLCAPPPTGSVLDYLGPWPWYIVGEELLALVNRGGEAVLLASEPALPADYRVGKTLRDAGRMG